MTHDPLGPSSARPSWPAREDDVARPSAEPTSAFGLAELFASSASASAPIGQAAAPAPGGGASALVGVCVEDRHPTLAGRVQVRFTDASGEQSPWLATLAHLPVRCEDRVLLVQPGNWPEPVVVGVIDGLRARTADTHPAATLTLRSDETLEIHDPGGAPLLAIVPTPAGPVLRLARADQRLEIAGRLAFAADSIDFQARGEVSLAAGGDVVVTGEEIKLN
jgi:hypothetical protein